MAEWTKASVRYPIDRGFESPHELKNFFFHLYFYSTLLHFLSRTLINEIAKTLDKKEQVVILQNKKGLDSSGTRKIETILYLLQKLHQSLMALNGLEEVQLN